MKLHGFQVKNEDYNWNNNEIEQLKKICASITKNPNNVHTTESNIYYYISHHQFDKKITPTQIKNKLKELSNLL